MAQADGAAELSACQGPWRGPGAWPGWEALSCPVLPGAAQLTVASASSAPGVSAHIHCLCESRPGCRRTWGRGRDWRTGVGAVTAARPQEGHHACGSRGPQSSRRTPRTQPFILSLLTLRPLISDSLPQGPVSLPVLTAPAGMDSGTLPCNPGSAPLRCRSAVTGDSSCRATRRPEF